MRDRATQLGRSEFRGPRARLQEPLPVLRSHDITFLRQFALTIAGLAALTLVLVLLAIWFNSNQATEIDPAVEARVTQRLAPVGGVYAGETGAAAAAAAAEAARAAAATQVAYDGSLDGQFIYGQLCGACHTSGAGGAPKLLKAEWSARIAQGNETLIKHAIEGFTGSAGMMPARGGNPALSDAQVEATVLWMVENLQ